MDTRYAVLLQGRKVGTIHLDPARRGTTVARLAPLPAFRAVARYRRTAAARGARDGAWPPAPEPPPGERAAEEGAEAVLGALEFSLVEDDRMARPVPSRRIELLPDEPPRLRITW